MIASVKCGRSQVGENHMEGSLPLSFFFFFFFFLFLDAWGVIFSTLYPSCGIFHYGMWPSLQLWCAGSRVCGLCSLQHRGSVIVVHGLSCPIACRIKPMSPSLEGIFITTGPWGKSWLFYFWHHPSPNQRSMLPIHSLEIRHLYV